MQIKQRNLVWLGILGALTGIAIFAEALPTPAALLLLGVLGVSAVASLFEFAPQRVLKNVQDKAVLTNKQSTDAREATERARARGSYILSHVPLLDVGLIALRENYEGMVMQRTRNLSLDDIGVRPYITVQIPATEADRHAMFTFEIIDAHGKTVYKHDQNIYLRDGKLNVLADTQMPLNKSTLNIAHGELDLKVYMNGDLLAVLGGSITPSTRDRWAGRRAENTQAAAQRLSDEPSIRVSREDEPVSLEELLRQQSSRN